MLILLRYVPARAAWAGGQPQGPTRSPHNSPPPQQGLVSSASSLKSRRKSEPYYEDVDPRFSQDHSKAMPSLLVPGVKSADQHPPGIQHSASYDSIQDGPLSESSNFTSISERGINPQWQSEQQRHQYGMGGVPNRQPQGAAVAQQRDFLLTSNPDFELGGGVPGGARGKSSNRGGGRGGPMPAGGMI